MYSVMCLSYWALAHGFVVYPQLKAKVWLTDPEHGEREIVHVRRTRGVGFRACGLSVF